MWGEGGSGNCLSLVGISINLIIFLSKKNVRAACFLGGVEVYLRVR